MNDKVGLFDPKIVVLVIGNNVDLKVFAVVTVKDVEQLCTFEKVLV